MRISLSLLDILTCGFGGVLLLFLATFAVWQEEAPQNEQAKLRNTPVFIWLVMPEDLNEDLFANNMEAAKWDCGFYQTAENSETKSEILQHYAVLYGKTLPVPEDNVVLKGLKSGQSVVCKVIINGKIITMKRNVYNGELKYSSLFPEKKP